MELRRVVTSLVSRWWVLVIIGLVGALAAAVFVQQRNSDIKPLWRAEASVIVPVTPVEGRPTGQLPDELSAALEIAQTANEDEVRKDTRFIEADATDGSLLFVALDRSEELASSVVETMRNTYVAADPNFDSDAELQALLDEATTIKTRLDELVPPVEEIPPLTPEEEAAQEAQRTVLESQQTAILTAMNEVSALKIDAETTSEINDYDEQLAGYAAQLEEVLLALGPLQPVEPVDPAPTDQEPPSDLPLADAWTVQALEARLAELETDSASLIVASVTGENLDLADPEVTDETPSEIPTWLGLVVGFLAGALIGSAVLLVRDRVKGVVWHQSDVSNLTVVAEPPATAMDADDTTDIERQRRKRSVQGIRSAIIGAGSPDTGSVVGFAAPLSTDAHVLEDLAYDVAESLSAVGRSVLVVDLGFTQKRNRSRYYEGTGDLRDLFESVADDEDTIRRRAQAVIGAADKQAQGLDVLVADPDIIEPADILAGRPVGELLDQGRKQYDIVIVIQPTTGIGSGAVIDAHLQQQIIVCTRGRTTISEIAREAIPASGLHVKVVGVVLVAPPSRRGRALPRVRRPAPAPRPKPVRAPKPAPQTVAKPAQTARKVAAKAEAKRPTEKVEAAEKPAPVRASAPSSPKRRPAERQPAPRRRRSSRSRQENSEEAAERLRALETYSVDESLYIKTPEPPADSA